MITFFSILLAFSCLIIVGAVLLQPAKSGISALGGTSQSVFGSTGGTTFLFRGTMTLGFLAMAICLFLSWYKISSSKTSVMDDTTPATLKIETPLTNPTAPDLKQKSVPESGNAAPTSPTSSAASKNESAPAESKK